MTFEEFDKFFDQLFEDARKMRDTKGKEYAAAHNDRLSNFKEQGHDSDLPPLKVWHTFFLKHMRAINSYVRHGREFSTEQIYGRFVDAVTYLGLGAALIKEEAEEKEAAKQRHTDEFQIKCENCGALMPKTATRCLACGCKYAVPFKFYGKMPMSDMRQTANNPQERGAEEIQSASATGDSTSTLETLKKLQLRGLQLAEEIEKEIQQYRAGKNSRSSEA